MNIIKPVKLLNLKSFKQESALFLSNLLIWKIKDIKDKNKKSEKKFFLRYL